jgi:hypothetical protein
MANIKEVMKERRKYSFGSFLLIFRHLLYRIFTPKSSMSSTCLERIRRDCYSPQSQNRQSSTPTNSQDVEFHSLPPQRTQSFTLTLKSLETETLLPLRVSGVFDILCHS